jgi:hypothetical protein
LVAASLVALVVGLGIGVAIGDSSNKTNVRASPSAPAPTVGPLRPNVTGRVPRRPRPSETPASVAIGKKVSYRNGASIQVLSYQPNIAPNQPYARPPAGMSYAIIDVQFCAGRVATRYSDLGFKAKMSDNHKYDATTSVKPPDLGSGVLSARSGCKRGYVTLQLPKGQKPVAIIWNYGTWRRTTWNVK